MPPSPTTARLDTAPPGALGALPWQWVLVPLLMVVLLAVFPDYFERKLYFNELLTLLGGLALLLSFRSVLQDRTALLVGAFIAFGVLRLCLVLASRTPWIAVNFPGTPLDFWFITAQQSAMVYGAVVFFLGYAVVPHLRRALALMRWPLVVLWVVILVVVPIVYAEQLAATIRHDIPVHRFSPPVLMPLIMGVGTPLVALALSVLSITAFAFSLQAITSLVGALGLIVYARGARWLWWALVAAGVLGFGIAIWYFAPNFALVYRPGYIEGVLASHPLLAADASTTWRLVLAWEVLVLHAQQNLWGIGFGTPLFDRYPVDDLRVVHPEWLPWTMSPHNSVLAVLARMGVLGAGLLLIIWYRLLDAYLRHRSAWRAAGFEQVAWAMLVLVITALINPFVDTPMHVGLHWFVVGLMAGCARMVSTGGTEPLVAKSLEPTPTS